MSVVRRDATRRWLFAVGGTAALIAVPVVLHARPANVAESPQTQPRALQAAAQGSYLVPHQGVVEIAATFGLPTLPFGEDETAALDSTRKVRTWWAAPNEWRVDTLRTTGQLSAFAIPVATGVAPIVRQWSFEENRIVDLVGDPTLRLPRSDDLVPPQLARRILAWAAPEDPVTALTPQRVAGIDAPGFRLTPADTRTTVSSVDVWVEPGSGLPLRVVVRTGDSERPVIDSRFLSVELTLPDKDVLLPQLVDSANRETTDSPDILSRISTLEPTDLPTSLAGLNRNSQALVPGSATYGAGFVRLAAVPLPSRAMSRLEGELAARGEPLTLEGGEGVLLESPLLTVVVIRDEATGQGFAIAGAVTPSTATAAAEDLLDAS